jgi:hypothetical protein
LLVVMAQIQVPCTSGSEDDPGPAQLVKLWEGFPIQALSPLQMLGQAAEVQVPLQQIKPSPQTLQAPPAEPQALVEVPG